MNIAVLISGRGSNMLALHQAIQKGSLNNVTLSLVISNNKEAAGLAKAKTLGLPTALVDKSKFNVLSDFENQLTRTIEQYPIDLLVLAGFMQLLSPEFVKRFAARIINIHPSLLPKYKGLDTHKRVLAAKDKKHGLTIHVVTAELDSGPIIMQKEISISNRATEESLAAELLIQEHLFLPLAIQLIAQQDIRLAKDRVFHQDWQLGNRGIRWDEHNHATMEICHNKHRLVVKSTDKTNGLSDQNKRADGEIDEIEKSVQKLLEKTKIWLHRAQRRLTPSTPII